jgi:ADP-ribose pyrophosphatase YjhB (NUDIX family)
MGRAILSNGETAILLRLFLEHEKVQFKDMERELGLRSNLVSYYVDKVLKEGLLVKRGNYYYLSEEVEKYLPLLSCLSRQPVGPIPVVLVALMNKGRILLIRRNRRPYKGYWSMVGGKMLHGEDIEDAALRLVKDKTGLDAEVVSLNAIFHERVASRQLMKHSFILFFVRAKVKDSKLKETEHGELKWFRIREVLDKKRREVIPSDYWLLKKKLSSRVKMYNAFMEEENGRIKSFELVR